MEYAVAQLVQALFDSRWDHWDISLT